MACFRDTYEKRRNSTFDVHQREFASKARFSCLLLESRTIMRYTSANVAQLVTYPRLEAKQVVNQKLDGRVFPQFRHELTESCEFRLPSTGIPFQLCFGEFVIPTNIPVVARIPAEPHSLISVTAEPQQDLY